MAELGNLIVKGRTNIKGNFIVTGSIFADGTYITNVNASTLNGFTVETNVPTSVNIYDDRRQLNVNRKLFLSSSNVSTFNISTSGCMSATYSGYSIKFSANLSDLNITDKDYTTLTNAPSITYTIGRGANNTSLYCNSSVKLLLQEDGIEAYGINSYNIYANLLKTNILSIFDKNSNYLITTNNNEIYFPTEQNKLIYSSNSQYTADLLCLNVTIVTTISELNYAYEYAQIIYYYTSGSNVTIYTKSGSSWSSTTKSISSALPGSRFYYNTTTNRLFYSTGSALIEIIERNATKTQSGWISTATQTISGNKMLQGNFNPSTSDTYNLNWKEMYLSDSDYYKINTITQISATISLSYDSPRYNIVNVTNNGGFAISSGTSSTLTKLIYVKLYNNKNNGGNASIGFLFSGGTIKSMYKVNLSDTTYSNEIIIPYQNTAIVMFTFYGNTYATFTALLLKN